MEQPNLPQDFVDLLEAFGRADIRYLIRSKQASGREQDLIDARNLERARPGPTQR